MRLELKFLVLMVLSLVFFSLSFVSANAAPFKANDKNPNIVAFFPDGVHGIPDEPDITHEGKEVVMRAGNSGNFQQWFYGTSDEGPGKEGDHTLWKLLKKDQCPDGSTLIPDAFPEWGDYLQPGADYCVKTNDFHVTGGHHEI